MRFALLASRCAVPERLAFSGGSAGSFLSQSPSANSRFISPRVSPHFSRGIRYKPLIVHQAVMSAAAVDSVAGTDALFAQVMLRVSDPAKSREFYQNLGMQYLTSLDFPDAKFSLYFLAVTNDTPPAESMSRAERANWLWTRDYPTLELTYNWPAEDGTPDDEKYVTGNESPRGFAEIRMVGGGNGKEMVDPDGYAVRVEPGDKNEFLGGVVRVKDKAKTAEFLSKLGMIHVRDDERGASWFAYEGRFGKAGVGLMECPGEELVNGNVKPYRGFGHFGVIVNDVKKTTEEMEKAGYGIVRQAAPFKDVGTISFVKEPDTDYWFEIIEKGA